MTERAATALSERSGHVPTLVVLLIAVAATAGVAALAQPRLSVNDEATHIDYAYRLSEGELVREGQRLDQVVLDEWACRGFFDPDVSFPECRAPGAYDPTSFPGSGYNYNDFHPPTYYALTGVAAAVLVEVTPIDSFVTAARLVGVAWIGSGLWIAYLLMVELGVARPTARSIALVGAFVPSVWQTGAAVTNDSATIVSGALVGLIAVMASRGRVGPWACAGVALLAVSTKTIVGIAVIGAAIFLLSVAVAQWRAGRPFRGPVVSAVAMVVTVPLVQLGWSAFQATRSIDPDYENPISGLNGVKAVGVPYREFFSEIFSLFTPSLPVYDFFDISTYAIDPWLTVVEALMGIAPLVVLLVLPDEPVVRRFGFSVATAAVIGVVLVTVQYWSGGRYYLPEASPRYGLVLIPLILVCIGVLFEQRPVGRRAAALLWTLGALATVPPLLALL